MINRKDDDVVIDEPTIAEGVSLVAGMLNQTYKDALIISVVPGGIFFTADLTRQLNFPIEMDYISCPHTPGEKNNTSEIVFHNNVGVEGRNIIIIDDAIESGGTMKRIVQYLSDEYNPLSISVATLFVKPGRVSIPVKCYYAIEMDNDDFLMGYGLPWEHKSRNLPFVCKVNTSG